MKRERLAWMVSLVLMAILALKLPGTMAQRDDDYAFVRTLVDIHRQISANYVEPVDEAALREKAIEGMISDLDPFSLYIPPEEQEGFDRFLDNSFRGVGIEFQMEDGKPTVVTPIDGSPAFLAGVLAGDVILKVNGKSVDGEDTAALAKQITGPAGTQVKMTVQHPSGDVVQLTMTRQEIVLPTVKGYQRKPDASWNYYLTENPKIAYVRLTQFTETTFDGLHDALVGKPAEPGKAAVPGLLDTGMKGLIMDLRFDPGGRLDQAIQVVNLFVKDGVIVSTKGRNRPEQIERADGKGTLPNFPMVVLVNDHSASAAEIVSGSLQDNGRAIVVGQRSFGKGSVQELIPLDDDSGELKLTVAYYYLPSGRLVHRKKDATDWGVNPQVVVPMDDAAEEAVMKGFAENEEIHSPSSKPTTQPVDAQLQEAINVMRGMIVQSGQSAAEAPPATQP